LFQTFHPSTGTRRNHRQHAAVLEPLQKFAGLFHDCQVCRKLGIKDIVKSELAQSRNQLAFHIASGLQPKRLADSRPNRRGKLGDLDQMGVIELVE